MNENERIQEALRTIFQYAGIDGGHHKQWVIDQVLKSLLGTPEAYEKWVSEYENGDDGPKTYEWETGITP